MMAQNLPSFLEVGVWFVLLVCPAHFPAETGCHFPLWLTPQRIHSSRRDPFAPFVDHAIQDLRVTGPLNASHRGSGLAAVHQLPASGSNKTQLFALM